MGGGGRWEGGQFGEEYLLCSSLLLVVCVLYVVVIVRFPQVGFRLEFAFICILLYLKDIFTLELFLSEVHGGFMFFAYLC